MTLCPNCQSHKHIECCTWCGSLVPKRRRDTQFCTLRCAKQAAEADKASAQEEKSAS